MTTTQPLLIPVMMSPDRQSSEFRRSVRHEDGTVESLTFPRNTPVLLSPEIVAQLGDDLGRGLVIAEVNDAGNPKPDWTTTEEIFAACQSQKPDELLSTLSKIAQDYLPDDPSPDADSDAAEASDTISAAAGPESGSTPFPPAKPAKPAKARRGSKSPAKTQPSPQPVDAGPDVSLVGRAVPATSSDDDSPGEPTE